MSPAAEYQNIVSPDAAIGEMTMIIRKYHQPTGSVSPAEPVRKCVKIVIENMTFYHLVIPDKVSMNERILVTGSKSNSPAQLHFFVRQT